MYSAYEAICRKSGKYTCDKTKNSNDWITKKPVIFLVKL